MGWSREQISVVIKAVMVFMHAVAVEAEYCAQRHMRLIREGIAGMSAYKVSAKMQMEPVVWVAIHIVCCVVWLWDRQGRRGKEYVKRGARRGRKWCILVMPGCVMVRWMDERMEKTFWCAVVVLLVWLSFLVSV